MRISGIYQIQSKLKPHKVYIGSAVNIQKRWNVHLCKLRGNNHYNKKLQNHFNKYGEIDLQFSVLLGCEIIDLIKTEQYFIDSYKPFFNNREIADSNIGFKFSKESLKKLSDAHKGIYPSKETLLKRSKSLKGKKSWNTGLHSSKETRDKQSEALKGRTWEDIYGIEGAKKRRESVLIKKNFLKSA
jgi:group I intron endonuclease